MRTRNSRADVERFSQVLRGLRFPAAKWQIVMQAEEYGADAATRTQLWALPARRYPELSDVLVALGMQALRPLSGAPPAAPPTALIPH